MDAILSAFEGKWDKNVINTESDPSYRSILVSLVHLDWQLLSNFSSGS